MPFYLPGGSTACLLLHGFCGTPAEMRPYGEYLNKRGITVLAVRLAGHGTRPSDLRGKTYHDWIRSAAEGLDELKRNCARIFIAGHSMGGTIALHLSAHHRVDGVITVCAPVYMDFKLYATRLISYLFNFRAEVERNIKDPEARMNHRSYSTTPLSAPVQFLALLRAVKAELNQISPPVLLFQSRDDRIVPPGNADYIYQHLERSSQKNLIQLKNSGHMATIDYDKKIVFTETYRFIERTAKAG